MFETAKEKFELKQLTIEITNKCFNECVHCSAYKPGEEKEKILEKETIISIINDFVSLGGIELNISGGEPILHPNLFEMATHAKKLGLKVNLFTCGIIPDDLLCDEFNLFGKFKEVNFDQIQITLHGSHAETHDQITEHPGSFEKTVSFIERLVKEEENVSVHFVPMQVNSEEIEDLIDFLKYLKVTNLHVLRFYPQGRGLCNKEWLMLDGQVTANLIKKIVELEKNPDVKIHIGHPGDFRFLINPDVKPNPCDAGINQCMINVDSDVLPCPAFGDLNDWYAGNINVDKLSSIWSDSPALITLRTGQEKVEYCSTCVHFDICRGRCPAQRYRQYGNISIGPDPECPKVFFE